MRILLFTFVLFLNIYESTAQNINLSNYQNHNSLISPALSGQGASALDLSGTYSTQWAAIESPYSTYNVQVEGQIKNNNNDNNKFGYGLSLVSDKAGDTNYKNNQIIANINYFQYIDNRISMGFGLGLSYNQNGLDADKVILESEILNESTSTNTYSSNRYVALNTGLHFSYNNEKNFLVYVGGSIQNLGANTKTLVNQNDIKIDPNYLGYLGFNYQSNHSLEWRQRNVLLLLNNNSSLMTGFELAYIEDDSELEDNTKYSLSVDYRVNDAFVFGASFNFKNINFYINHDVTISNLNKSDAYASSTSLGFSISLGEINLQSRATGCPYQ